MENTLSETSITDNELLEIIKNAVHQIDNVEKMAMRDVIYTHNTRSKLIKIFLLKSILENMHGNNEIEKALVKLIKGVPI